MGESKILLFDGYCNLCNGWVDFIIQRDFAKKIKFASLQSESAAKFVSVEFRNSLPSVVFISGNCTYFESEAVVRVLAELGGIWRLALLFLLIPDFIRNWIYRYIAKNRYRWFGRRSQCRIPTSDEQSRFL